jgi:hypothetical protein
MDSEIKKCEGDNFRVITDEMENDKLCEPTV